MELTPCLIFIIGEINMEIEKFSQAAGISVHTLRYYNKINLIAPERINNKRCYTEADIEKAAVIIKLKCLNFSLDEIKKLFELEEDINEDEPLKSENKCKIKNCLELIVEKYDYIIKQEQDLLLVKLVLKKMIDKTNKLLRTGTFFTDNKNDNSIGEDNL